MAIDEINKNGGVLGQQIRSAFCDGQTDPEIFAVCAQMMVDNVTIQNVFGTKESFKTNSSYSY